MGSVGVRGRAWRVIVPAATVAMMSAACDPRALHYPDGGLGAGGAGGAMGGTCGPGQVDLSILFEDVKVGQASRLVVRIVSPSGLTVTTNLAHMAGDTVAQIVYLALPSDEVAGQSFRIVIDALDASGNVVGSGQASENVPSSGGCAGARVTISERVVYELVPQPVGKLDMLLVVDTSPGMLAQQNKFAAQMAAFMDILKMLPDGGGSGALPNLHVGVISADTGAGAFDLAAQGCRVRGDGGQFRSGGTTACPVSPLDPQTQLRYLVAQDDQRQTNYRGDIADALACLVKLGDQGCFISSPLEAARWALDPVNPPPGHQGFLRPDSLLLVIVLSRQDDCSLPDGSTLFDPMQDSLAAPLGPLTNFRCNDFGNLCDVGGGLLPPSRGAPQTPLTCQSNELPTGKLTTLADEIAFLKGLKSDPSRVFVAAIAGPNTPYITTRTSHVEATGAIEMVPSLVPSCVENSGETGLPAVRLQQWALAFGATGLFETICAVAFAPALMQVATSLSHVPTPQCLAPSLYDVDARTPVVDPDCIVTDQTTDSTGATTRTLLPACDDPNASRPCWSARSTTDCTSGLGLFVTRAEDAPPGTTTTASCQICPPGFVVTGCPL